MDKWNPTTFWDTKETQGQSDQSGDDERSKDQSKFSCNDKDQTRHEQQSVYVDQNSSTAEAQRQPVDVFPSDFGGYILHPDTKSTQSSELQHGSEDMVSRKQPPSSLTTEEPHHNPTPLPDYEDKPALTHDKNVDFFGDTITTEPHGISRSMLDQDSLLRGSVSTLPSAGRNRRSSSHKRGVPITSMDSALHSNVNMPPQVQSASAVSNIPIGDEALHENDNQNLSSRPTEDTNPPQDDNRKQSIADRASAAVLAGSTAVAGVAAAASAAILGSSKPKEGAESQRMPSAWPSTTSPSDSAGLDISDDAAQHAEKKDATNCNYEPAIHGQSACFHTKDEVCEECHQDEKHAFCEHVQEPSIHGEKPSFYASQSRDSVDRHAIDNVRITGLDFAGSHHKPCPTDEELATGTNAVYESKMINAHNAECQPRVGSTHDKVDYSADHGINCDYITANDLTDAHCDFINAHPINQPSGATATSAFTGIHDSTGIDSAAITGNDMTQHKSHLAADAAIGTAAALGAGAGAAAAIGSAGTKQDANEEPVSPSDDYFVTMEEGQIPRAITPRPSTAATTESHNISSAYRTDAQGTISDMITPDHPGGTYLHNNVDDVYRTDAQGATQNMITSENPTTTTAVTNNDVTDVYRTDAQGTTQNMITPGNPTTDYAYNNVDDVYCTVPRSETPQDAPHYESTPRASGEVGDERDMAPEHHGKGLLAGGGIAAAVGGLFSKYRRKSHDKGKLQSKQANTSSTGQAPSSQANEPENKDLNNQDDLDTQAVPTTTTGSNELGNNTASRDVDNPVPLPIDRLPPESNFDQTLVSNASLDKNAQPQQMRSATAAEDADAGNVNDNAGDGADTTDVGKIATAVGATCAAVGVGGAALAPPNKPGTSTESFSSSRAIRDTIVPDVRGQDEVKDRHENFKNVADSTDTSFRNNQEQKGLSQKRENSLTHGFKTGTAAVASAFRRMSTGGSSSKKRNSIGKEHVRRLSDAEAFKNHTLASDANKENLGSTGATSNAAGTKNNVDVSPTEPGITGSDTSERLKYTGVQRDYARIPGVYSLNTSANAANLDPVNGENNFVKVDQEETGKTSPSKGGGYFFGQKGQRRGSIQKTFDKLFRSNSGQKGHNDVSSA